MNITIAWNLAHTGKLLVPLTPIAAYKCRVEKWQRWGGTKICKTHWMTQERNLYPFVLKESLPDAFKLCLNIYLHKQMRHFLLFTVLMAACSSRVGAQFTRCLHFTSSVSTLPQQFPQRFPCKRELHDYIVLQIILSFFFPCHVL